MPEDAIRRVIEFFEVRSAIKQYDELLAAIDQHSFDMHHPSSRPCGTCDRITKAIGKPFGCYAWQEKRKKVTGDAVTLTQTQEKE